MIRDMRLDPKIFWRTGQLR